MRPYRHCHNTTGDKMIIILIIIVLFRVLIGI